MKSFTINIPFNQSIHNQLVSLYGTYISPTQKGKYTIPVFHFETAYKIIHSRFPALTKPLLVSASYRPVREYYKLLLANAANSARIASNFDFQYSDDIRPLPYQKSGVEAILERFKQEQKGCILSDEPGCISGEAIVTINRGGASRKYTLEKAYLKFNNLYKRKNLNWDLSIPTTIRCLKDNRFGQHEIEKIVYSGEKNVIEIETENGKILKLTEDHRILTETGWKEIRNINIDEKICTNGINKCKMCGSTKNIITHKYSKFIGYCKKCMYSSLRKNGSEEVSKYIGTDGYVYLTGGIHRGKNKKSHNGILEHRYIMEIVLGRKLKKDEEVHHIDKNRQNNSIDNLVVLTKAEHSKIHKTETHFKNFVHKNGSLVITIPQYEKLIRKTVLDKKEKTYDISMKDPFHNFVANGIVVHNCGKTAQAIWAFYAIQDYINKNRNIHKTNSIDNERLTQKSLTTSLVVCPASVLSTWQEEWAKCAHLRNPNITILGANSQPEPGPEIFITNYDSLWTNRKWLYAQNFDYVVLDEAHNFATGTSKRGRVMKELANRSQFTLLLSGTPIRNYVWQLRYLLNLIDPNSIWNNSINYETTFCDRKQGKYGIDKTGYSNLRLLKRILKMHYLIRRKKNDVLKQLPKKTVIFEPINI